MWRMLFCMFLVGQERAFAEDRRCDFSQPKRKMAEEEKKKKPPVPFRHKWLNLLFF